MGSSVLQLCPSEIRFTQDSIKTTFEKPGHHQGKLIGKTLDELCDGVTKIYDIPRMRVFLHDEHWWSTDNRRLWVFRHYNRLGGCERVQVKRIDFSEKEEEKFTTRNGGRGVRVRGDPGGNWHRESTGALCRQIKQNEMKPGLSNRHQDSVSPGRHQSKSPSYSTIEATGAFNPNPRFTTSAAAPRIKEVTSQTPKQYRNNQGKYGCDGYNDHKQSGITSRAGESRNYDRFVNQSFSDKKQGHFDNVNNYIDRETDVSKAKKAVPYSAADRNATNRFPPVLGSPRSQRSDLRGAVGGTGYLRSSVQPVVSSGMDVYPQPELFTRRLSSQTRTTPEPSSSVVFGGNTLQKTNRAPVAEARRYLEKSAATPAVGHDNCLESPKAIITAKPDDVPHKTEQRASDNTPLLTTYPPTPAPVQSQPAGKDKGKGCCVIL